MGSKIKRCVDRVKQISVLDAQFPKKFTEFLKPLNISIESRIKGFVSQGVDEGEGFTVTSLG